MKSIALMLAVTGLFSLSLRAADEPSPSPSPSEPPEPEPIRLTSFDDEKALDASSMSYELTRSFMTKEQWDEQVAAFRKKFEDWEKDNEGDVGRYLNDRFLLVALGAISGEVEKIKRALVWLALYKEFNQQVPGVVTTAVTRHHESLCRLFRDFTWEKASQYVKNKEWRKDNTPRKTETAVVSNDKKGG